MALHIIGCGSPQPTMLLDTWKVSKPGTHLHMPLHNAEHLNKET